MKDRIFAAKRMPILAIVNFIHGGKGHRYPHAWAYHPYCAAQVYRVLYRGRPSKVRTCGWKMLVWYWLISMGCALLPSLSSLLHFGGSWRLIPCQSARAAFPVLLILTLPNYSGPMMTIISDTSALWPLSQLHASVQSAVHHQSHSVPIHTVTHCHTH